MNWLTFTLCKTFVGCVPIHGEILEKIRPNYLTAPKNEQMRFFGRLEKNGGRV
jgi:hypothetical protein